MSTVFRWRHVEYSQTFPLTFDAASAVAACASAGEHYYPGQTASVSGSGCYLNGNPFGIVDTIESTDPPTPPASAASAITCTASSPCVMNLSATQFDASYHALLALAVVCLFALGFMGGQQQ